MPVNTIDIQTFLMWTNSCPIIDVRSPGEYVHAHVPGAVNLPLFSNEERVVVGTTYKQQSREQAIKVGLQYFGPKLVKMIEEVESMVAKRNNQRQPLNGVPPNAVLVHCWRGGMRSAGVAWLLDLYGFKVYTLKGGYKSFRNWAQWQFKTVYSFQIVGGYTGSGKTYLLQQLANNGKAVVDLEGLANHKGSALGAIGMPPQPSQEMFENVLALALQKASSSIGEGAEQLPAANTIWLEDESQRIGNVNIPANLWIQMRASPVLFVDIPFEERLQFLVVEYGKGEKEKIMNAILRIQKRLGPLETKTAINHLLENDFYGCFSILLKYYDKYYLKGLYNRDNFNELVATIPCPTVNAAQNAITLSKTTLVN